MNGSKPFRNNSTKNNNIPHWAHLHVSQQRSGPVLTVEDWIMVHLLRYARYAGEFEVPWAMTQYGIAEAVGTGQDHVSRAVRRLVQKGFLSEAKNRVEGVSEKRKVYFLTPEGQASAAELVRQAEGMTVIIREDGGERRLPLKEAAVALGPGRTLIEVARAILPDGRLDRKALEGNRRAQEAEATLPVSPPARFFGRFAELETLRMWLEEGRMVVIQGIPGIGKTSLAAKLVADARGNRPVFWYRFHEWDSPRNFLASLAEFLAQQGRRKLKMHLSYKQDMDIGEACYIIRDSTRGLEAFMVLDDVHKASAGFLPCLSLFTDMLQGHPGLRFILTTRSPRPFYDRSDVIVRGRVGELKLEGLDVAGSRQLLRARNVGEQFQAGAIRMTGGHPLALELFEPGPEEAQRKWNIAKYIEEEIGARLSADEKKLMRMASVFRYPVPADAVLREEGLTYDVLEGLVARSLLREHPGGLIDIHDFLRDFFYSRLTQRERAALHLEAAGHYIGLEGPRPRLELVHHLLRAGEQGRAAGALAGRGEELFSAGCVDELRGDIGEMDLDALDEHGRAEMAYLGGRSCDIAGDWDAALGFYGRALASEDGGRRADVHYRIGWIQQKRNMWKEAAHSFRLGLALSRAGGDRKGQAQAYHGLGRVLWRQGRWTEAAETLDRSISMARSAGEEALEASAGIELGRVLASAGEYAQAEKSLRRSLEILERRGDVSEAARAYNTIGWEILRPQGRLDEALDTIHKGEEMALTRGDMRELAPIYHSLGELWTRKGFNEKASEYFHKSLELFERQRDVHGAAYNHLGLAIIASAGRQFDRAAGEFQKALKMFEDAKTPMDIAYAYEEYARMLQARGDLKEAAACSRKARKIFEGLKRTGKRN